MTEESTPKSRGNVVPLAVAVVALLVALAGIGVAQLTKPAAPVPQDRDIRLVIAAFEPHDESMMMEEVHMFFPATIVVNKGDTIHLTVLNMDEHRHGFRLGAFDVATDPDTEIAPGEEVVLPAFTVDRAGVFEFECNVAYVEPPPMMEHEDCGEDHEQMVGALVVKE